ncbi:MAG TPA: hypothetical protein VK190_04825 [Pseudoneobacillus sp.]|nr:hypothetical protein [Pseudoneobacillus sp.]
MNKFYVYEWFIVDTLEVFYVGKGKGNRMFCKHRNKYFNNIINKYSCDVRFYKRDLTEQEAFDLEKSRIIELKVIGQAKANLAPGGIGGYSLKYASEEKKNEAHKKQGRSLSLNGKIKGENNPNYGNKWSKEKRSNFSQKIKESENNKGINNPRSKIVFVLDKDKRILEKFKTVAPCAEKYKMKPGMVYHYLLTKRFCKKKNVYFSYEVDIYECSRS